MRYLNMWLRIFPEWWIEWSTGKWHRKEKYTYLPLSGGFHFSWNKSFFSICTDRKMYPAGEKRGQYRFSASVGIMYWYIKIIFYDAMTETEQELAQERERQKWQKSLHRS